MDGNQQKVKNESNPAQVQGTIPDWATAYLNEVQISEIQSKIAQIEKLTSAELVPMVVKSAVDVKAIHRFLFVIVLGIFSLIFKFLVSSFWLTSLEQIVVVIIGGGLIWLSYQKLLKLPFLKRWLLSQSYIQGEVFKRAQLEFYQTKMQDAKSRGGILFLVSIEDRAAAVYADPQIAEILKQDVWIACINDLVAGARIKVLSQGFNAALERVSQLLAKDLPAEQHNENEISNQVIIKP